MPPNEFGGPSPLRRAPNSFGVCQSSLIPPGVTPASPPPAPPNEFGARREGHRPPNEFGGMPNTPFRPPALPLALLALLTLAAFTSLALLLASGPEPATKWAYPAATL